MLYRKGLEDTVRRLIAQIELTLKLEHLEIKGIEECSLENLERFINELDTILDKFDLSNNIVEEHEFIYYFRGEVEIDLCNDFLSGNVLKLPKTPGKIDDKVLNELKDIEEDKLRKFMDKNTPPPLTTYIDDSGTVWKSITKKSADKWLGE
jgi:hypothetical protein